MNKKELVEQIAASAELTKVQAELALNSFMSGISQSLKKSENVTLVGFGTFSASKREARKGRNPQTGKEIDIPAKTVVKFKAGKVLGDEVNNG